MSGKNTTTKIAKSGLWLTASYAISRVAQLIAQICLARLLSPEDFGVWAMVLVVTILTDLFQDNATAAVLIQRGLEDKKLVDAVYSLGVNISIFMFVVQALIGLPISWFFQQPVLFPLIACVSFKFVINAGTGTRAAILQRQMKFREIAISNIGNGIARMCGTLILAAFGFGVWSFAGGEICKAIVDAALKRLYCRYDCTYHFFPDQQAVREVWSFTSSLIGINLAVYANTNGDNFLIGKLLGAQSLGFYNLAYQLAMLPAFALSQINKINFSVLSQRDDEGKKSYLRQMLEYYALFYAPIYSLGFVVAPWIIPLVYGSQWLGAVPIFQIVLIFAYARGFMSILGTTLNALNQPRTNAVINLALVPLSLPSFFIGAKLGGTVGVAIAVAIVMGIGATIWFWFATCRAAKWNVATLASPVILPTVAAIFSAGIVIFSTASLTLQMQIVLQPLLVILINAFLVSILSKGRVPRKVLKLIKETLISKTKSVKT
ncbi:lipopolysaccharide biosynthesis protein [Anabaena sphaerica FACHB-251]|uniref:Lipopolysaccharide biosynthesis protein n=1 Tax=Anabaena sphaerica FACHB-251 TaxID=2692883 RepID=A0A927A028_9NOST|nr:lipopolysaccharide biosynthesis protein [Anabaena sphaerica]MBD2293061.1 lipopolysaccharide biosynthesis protein [Anabaena sphaerica FACHB-251]